VTGTGDDETAALRDLDATLRGAKPATGSYLEALRERLRLAYVDGAEEWSRDNVGGSLTVNELTDLLPEVPGVVIRQRTARLRATAGVGGSARQ
jgi:hypothetical protein